MTFKEWMVENNPGFISRYTRGTYGCPYEYGLEISEESNKNCTVNGGKGCEYCWNREMPMTLKELIEKKKMYFKSKFNVGDKVMVNPNWEREFPYRDNFGIESWKKYLGKEFTVMGEMYGALELYCNSMPCSECIFNGDCFNICSTIKELKPLYEKLMEEKNDRENVSAASISSK